jgi:hypothetical protein
MTQGKFMQFQENIYLRDIDTLKIKKKFRSITAAKMYLRSLPFGLNNYYEIFDDTTQKIVYRYVNCKRRSKMIL